MKARKMIVVLSVFTMMTGIVIGGSGNLYADDYFRQNKLEKIETLVADLKLSDSQKGKYADFRASLKVEPTESKKKEKNMDFVNQLITVPCF